MFDRYKFSIRYEMKFSQDFKKCFEGFTIEEQIHLVDSILSIIKCYKEDPINYEAIQKIHEDLLKKYRKRLTNFNNIAITEYFSENPNMKHLNLQHDLKVEHEGEEENFFTESERKQFLKHIEKYLKNHKGFLYLQTEPENEEKRKEELSGTDKKKEKLTRERRDKATKLTEAQTALLGYLLSKTRIILPIGEQYHDIENTDIGRAFSILTRFSADNLRQSIGEKKLNHTLSKKNLDAVGDALQQTINYIAELKRTIKDPKNPS